MIFKTDYRLMLVKSIAECFKGSILQYFRPSLTAIYQLSLRPLFWLFLSGHFTQVLLYTKKKNKQENKNQQNVQIRLITRLLNFRHFPQPNDYELSD